MRGYLIERYNRFLADIRTRNGDTITAYCPATGRMTTCLRKTAPVEYVRVKDPGRKLDYDWWSIKMPESWVVIDTRPANDWLYWSRKAPWLPDRWTGTEWVPEPSLPEGGRLDYRLVRENQKDLWIEIKSVTWCEEGIGYFPDAPTQRGRRHLRELMTLAEEGHPVWVVFVSMRSDIQVIRPGGSVDPDFENLLGDARAQGVHLLGVQSRVEDRSLWFTGRVPVEL